MQEGEKGTSGLKDITISLGERGVEKQNTSGWQTKKWLLSNGEHCFCLQGPLFKTNHIVVNMALISNVNISNMPIFLLKRCEKCKS